MDLGAKVAVVGVVIVLIAGAAFVGVIGFNMAQDAGSGEQVTNTHAQSTNPDTGNGNESDGGTDGDADATSPEGPADDSSTENDTTDASSDDSDDTSTTGSDDGNDSTDTDNRGRGSGDDSTDTGDNSVDDGDDDTDTGNDGGDGGDDETSGDEREASIAVGSATIGSAERTEVPFTLESAPDGMAGFRSTITVDTGVATIESGTIANEFANISNVSVADDGSSVTVKAVDANETVDNGTGDVRLATLTIEGVESGSTRLEVRSERFEDDDGNPRPVSTTDGEVTVSS
ncbi:hypothetical protein [Natrinema salinisoli]|uniref:hypothetical protein n=1 Tax=Natrinema salinisoli TaxID=2878535 RepID=UPI001CF0CD98|nr:hypothetical protein [Natrinema salinisoli]